MLFVPSCPSCPIKVQILMTWDKSIICDLTFKEVTSKSLKGAKGAKADP